MKTKEELNLIKEECENINKKLAELNEDELEQVVGGWHIQHNTTAGCVDGDKKISMFIEDYNTMIDKLP